MKVVKALVELGMARSGAEAHTYTSLQHLFRQLTKNTHNRGHKRIMDILLAH